MNKKFMVLTVLFSAATVGAVNSFFLMKDEKTDAPSPDISVKPIKSPHKQMGSP